VIVPFDGKSPQIDPSVWLADSAVIVGDVVLGAGASVWFHAVVRGDVERIRIGARSNVQDHATVHVTGGRWPTLVGDDVTIGHAAVVHGCTVGHRCLVGIGAIVLDGAELGDDCLVGAGALVTPGTKIPPRSLVLGAPARRARDLTDAELAHLRASAAGYVSRAAAYRAAGVR